MTRRSRLLLAALLIVVVGLAISLPLTFGGGGHSEQAVSPPPVSSSGTGSAFAGPERAFQRFAARCLTANAPSRCSSAAGRFLGRLAAVRTRITATESRIESRCGQKHPPPRCTQEAELVSRLHLLDTELRDYASRVLAKYPDAKALAPSNRGPGPPSARTTLTGSIEQTDQTWVCNRPVRLDSVTVTITAKTSWHQTAGIRLDSGCTGTIGAIHVTNAVGDGVDVHDARNLTINGGSILCNGHGAQAHQDGIQAMSGSNVVFRNVNDDCRTANNSGFFVNSTPESPAAPHRILFVHGRIASTHSSTAFVTDHQTGSGVKNSVLCSSRYFTYRMGARSTAINVGNTYRSHC